MTLHSILIQKLLTTNSHISKRVAEHHFKIYAYGVRNGQTIIDSDKTLICLRSALSFISHLARTGPSPRFLFVNTNPLFDEIVEQMTKKIGTYSPKDSVIWKMGGFLTNCYSPKKFRSRNKRLCFAPVQPPDCVVVIDSDRKSSVILEADRLQVPIIALVDSDVPWEYYRRIAYPIPADDSIDFVYLFCNLITKTLLLEKKRRKELEGESMEDKPGKGVEQIEQSDADKSVSSSIDEVLVVPYESLAPTSVDIAETKELVDKLVVVNFNGNLGKSLGIGGPKSAVEVREGLSSLDLIVSQIQSLNAKYGCHLPLVVVDATRTHDETQKELQKYSSANVDILSFAQESLGSNDDKSYSTDHAAAFLSLMKSGTLDVLLSKGKEYVYLATSDNVAASVDLNILNHIKENKIDYCMEVISTMPCDSSNTVADGQGKVKLVEIAQNPSRYSRDMFKFINTRSLWINLKAIKRLVDTDALKLENLSTSQILLQETAAGSAIGFFDQAIAVAVPQSRFIPLNSTSDLLLLQSDLYSCAEGTLVQNTAGANTANPSIELGPEFEKISDFKNRVKFIPSVVGLDSLKVVGNVWFGAGITLRGRVSIVAKPGTRLEIPDGAVLEDVEINDPKDILK